MIDYTQLPRAVVNVNAGESLGPLETWRQTLGQGGTNSQPLPHGVVHAVRQLKPRLIRIFLQEFFDIYPDHGAFNWSKLDPFMDSLAQTGATVLATINIKPPCLFPRRDQDTWLPTDVGEYQQVIAQLVRRYSVEKPIVTHWEHYNEADIGENGGCPFRITSAEELHRAYQMLIQPVLAEFPAAQVGGPCTANPAAAAPFVAQCISHGTPLDFISYHLYHDSAGVHRSTVAQIDEVRRTFPGKRPEIMINEWNKGFDTGGEGFGEGSFYDFVSVEEMAYHPRRAAQVAKIMLGFMQSPLDWSFYYHIWDKGITIDEFNTFFSPEGVKDVMYKHWNEAPHRFGLFSENGRVRPQYFVYQMLGRMQGERVTSTSQHPDLAVMAGRKEEGVAVMVVNHNPQKGQDRIVRINFTNLSPGVKHLRTCRIDAAQRWSHQAMELLPVEERVVEVLPTFSTQVLCPADSVVLVEIIPV